MTEVEIRKLITKKMTFRDWLFGSWTITFWAKIKSWHHYAITWRPFAVYFDGKNILPHWILCLLGNHEQPIWYEVGEKRCMYCHKKIS